MHMAAQRRLSQSLGLACPRCICPIACPRPAHDHGQNPDCDMYARACVQCKVFETQRARVYVYHPCKVYRSSRTFARAHTNTLTHTHAGCLHWSRKGFRAFRFYQLSSARCSELASKGKGWEWIYGGSVRSDSMHTCGRIAPSQVRFETRGIEGPVDQFS